VHPHTGNPLDRSQVLKRFKRYLKAAGIRTIRFHDLRHTFGTTVAASGKTNIRTLQEWMGHARPNSGLMDRERKDLSPVGR
jgi:integrase